jgi:hypothetical protein
MKTTHTAENFHTNEKILQYILKPQNISTKFISIFRIGNTKIMSTVNWQSKELSFIPNTYDDKDHKKTTTQNSWTTKKCTHPESRSTSLLAGATTRQPRKHGHTSRKHQDR